MTIAKPVTVPLSALSRTPLNVSIDVATDFDGSSPAVMNVTFSKFSSPLCQASNG